MSISRIWKGLGNKLALAFAIPTLVINILYWGAALNISGGIGFPIGCENWSCSPPAHFLPWPWEPEICVEVVTTLDPIDKVLCSLARTGLFIPMVIAEAYLARWIGKRLGTLIERKRSLDDES